MSTLKPLVKIGDKLLRRKEFELLNIEDAWLEFTVNETYLKLVEEFPENYRRLDGIPIPLQVTNPKTNQP